MNNKEFAGFLKSLETYERNANDVGHNTVTIRFAHEEILELINAARDGRNIKEPVGTTAPVNSATKPNYYVRGGVECKDAVRPFIMDLAGNMAGYMFSLLCYLWRFAGKNGAEDIAKAGAYCCMIYNELPDREGKMEMEIRPEVN